MKKIISVLLAFILLSAACTACAGELSEEEYFVLDDLGYELWITPEVQPEALTEEDREGGFVAYFVDQAYRYIVSITYFPDLGFTLEEYAEALHEISDVSEITITAINDIPCITYVTALTDITARTVTVVQDNDVLELTFAPYDDPEFAAVIDRMIQSFRKTE